MTSLVARRVAMVVVGALVGFAPTFVPAMTPAQAAVPGKGHAAGRGIVGTVSTTLRIRRGPATYSDQMGLVSGGARVALACAVRGELVTGTVQATRQWDRLLDGRYISHAYVHSGTVPVCAEPAPPAASMTTAQFVEAAGALAREGHAEFDVPASVTVAQAILESGWGGSQLTANDHNFFGIECFGWPGSIAVDCHTYRTTECDGAGHCWQTDAQFRTYATTADSFRDHGLFLRANSRYAPAFGYVTNADQFLVELCRAGYATSPTYCTNLSGLMHQYNLYRFDS